MNISAQRIKKKAAEITELQKGFTSSSDEQRIAELITSTRGPKLTRLKLELDSGEGHYDLLELLYHDIDDKACRERLINHIKTHSPEIRKEERDIRIISDIDDTLYSSLHDSRYVRGTTYPGVLTFHQELAKQGDSTYNNLRDIILLTARPRDQLGLIERFTKDQMMKRGLGEAVVLSGDLLSLLSHRSMAEKKLQNFSRYQQLYPEFDFLFVGDSGQGDVVLGEMMLDEFPDRIRTVLIHQLKDNHVQSEDYVTFRTYLGAALELMRRQIIGREACTRIAEAVKDDMASVRYSSSEQLRQTYAAYLLDASRL